MANDDYGSEVQSAFARVISTVGSVRREAFATLRGLPQLSAFVTELDSLAELDKESTDFESKLRVLQRRVHTELGGDVSRNVAASRPLTER